MFYEEIQDVYQLCSYLLSYPSKEFFDSLTEIESEIDSLQKGKIKKELQQFITKVKELSPDQLVDMYVYTFDFGKKTNLYVTYMSSGEQRERGVDLLFLKNYYKEHGFQATDLELPDYLPLMLEFAGQVEAETLKPVFVKYYNNIVEIQDGLLAQNNLFGHIVAAALEALHESGIKKQKRRSVVEC
ncbi:MAG TPA: nitrate reductase molybdenum cofactor assembly chaperone [Bacillales bacterium]|nr:nitrate reductase molybdenum cofactor assembly chaperone [Bacillales bacterium]